MAERLLQLDDVRQIDSPQKVASLFQKIGYNASAQQLAIGDLELPARSAEAIWDAYMIADYQKGNESLQVLLFQLQENEWLSNSAASNRMRSLAQSLCRRPSNYLLLGTKDFDQLMLVNPRKSFDADMNLKVSIRKLLIDRANPTNYDRDRLDAIAARNLSPQELYKVQCEAFDVEKLTKEFYRGYREIFEELQRVIKVNNQHSYFSDPNRLHQFSQRLLGRVMFLYFLQKKEFLGSDRNFLKNQYNKLRSDLEDTDFYNQVLERLFFEMLNKPRSNNDSSWGKIPYLNGGLFDRDYGIGVIDAAGVETPPQIELPNSLFDPSGDKGILRFFNSYNFTVSENVQGDEDAAVDPEMLGKVFENMLASEERGQSGTFYTPRGVVQFMCVESLSRYLADATGMDLEAVKKLTEYDPELPDSDINQLLTNEQAKKLKLALTSVRICDPAVGSGAFPMGMMQVILSVKQAIAYREGMTVQRGSLTISQWKRDIIANNLYGVDIKPEAVEIAKLRMWLSLVVDIPDIDDVEPLPNLDYKLMCGDSLISTIQGEQLIPPPQNIPTIPTKKKKGEFETPRGDQLMIESVTPIQIAIQPLLDLQRRYFDAQAEERHQLREQILAIEANVFRVAVEDRYQFWVSKQQELKRKIKAMNGKVSKAQEKEQAQITEKLAELNKFAAEVEKGMRSLNFFQWHLHFNEVFQEKGGFDIVIGNPPYLNIQKINDKNTILQYQTEFTTYRGKADILYFFIEKANNILKNKGILSLITASYFTKSYYADKIRKFIVSKYEIEKIVDFGCVKVFESAEVDTCILELVKTNKIHDEKRFLYSILFDLAGLQENLESIFTRHSIRSNENCYIIKQLLLKDLSEKPWTFQESNSQLNTVTSKLEELCYIGKGVATGKDDIFIVSQEVINFYKIEHTLLEPLIESSSINKYSFKQSESFLLKTNRGIDISLYPNALRYLTEFKKQLEERYAVKNEGLKWYEIVRYNDDLFNNKVLEQIICYYRSPSNKFAYTNRKFISLTTSFILTPKKNFNINIKYVLGLLNSKFIESFCVKNAKRMGQCFEYSSKFLASIPINRSTLEQEEEIIALVEKILETTSDNLAISLQNDIDEIVYKIYG